MHNVSTFLAEFGLSMFRLKSPVTIKSAMPMSIAKKSNRKAMNRNWCNQKANPALKTKAGNK